MSDKGLHKLIYWKIENYRSILERTFKFYDVRYIFLKNESCLIIISIGIQIIISFDLRYNCGLEGLHL